MAITEPLARNRIIAEKGNAMLIRNIIAAGLWVAAGLASAAEAGKVIFVAGAVNADTHALALGAAVNEGELLTTGKDGYVYIKTIDDGLFILRPNTKARIAAYHVDKVNPANTRVKLELMSGVARSQSGKAVKLARQNFRFNTPVAAIGVRGTDFTVFTDDLTSRVAVLSGGITISGFGDGCAREGSGPCEGASSRDLSASQKGQLLQIRRGQAAAQLVSGASLSPDNVAPPRADEPVAKPTAPVAAAEPYVEPRKVAELEQQVKTTPPVTPGTPNPPPVTVPPIVVDKPGPVVPPPPPVVVVPPVDPGPVVVVPDPVPAQPESGIVWGRFAAIAGQPAQINLTQQGAANAQLISLKGGFALLRSEGKEYVAPERGSVSFALRESEAYIYSDNLTVAPVKAQLENGQLSFDFDKRKYATSFDLVNNTERFQMRSLGSVAPDGRFSVDDLYAPGNNMSVDGVLSKANGGTAAYLFQGRLDNTRSASGATYWGAK
jgi:hypothetical protein